MYLHIPQNYRLLEPVEWWKASIHFDEEASLKSALKETANERQMIVSGYLQTHDRGLIYSITRTRRRVNEIVPEIEDYMNLARVLNEKVDGTMKVIQPEEFPPNEINVLFGLVEGYTKEGEQPIIHTVAEVNAALSSVLFCYPVKILSIRPGDESPYEESAVVIESPMDNLREIDKLATAFKQTRYTVEDIHNRKSLTFEARDAR